MSEWKEYQLGEVAPLAKNRILATDVLLCDYISTENMIADKGGVMEASSMPHNGTVTRFVKGDVLVSNIRPYFKKIWFADRDGGCSPDVLCFHCDEKKIQNKYLYYLLSQNDFFEYVMLGSKGCKMPRGDQAHIMAWRVRVPLLEVQETITEILSSLDDKIDLLNRENITLESLAETLFRQYFIENANPHWAVGPLGDILTVKGGSTPSTSNSTFWGGNIAWSSPRDITSLKGIYLFDTERKITTEGLSQISSGLLPKQILLMSSRAPVGILAFTEIPVAINQGYIAIIDNKGYAREFIYLLLKHNIDLVHSYSNGSTFMEISKSTFKSLKISIPPQNIVKEFQKIIFPFFEKIKVNSIQIRNLTKLRDMQLSKLMVGKISVNE